MAKQKGIIPVTGTIGELTFYQSEHGNLVRLKGKGISKERIFGDEKFAKTRDHIAEFSQAQTAAKLIRTSFRTLANNSRDKKMNQRLGGFVLDVIQSDIVNERGTRKIASGDMQLLKGFDFNEGMQLLDTMFATFNTTIDRTTGRVNVELLSFIPSQAMKVPEKATHFRVNLGAAEIDFANLSYKYVEQNSALLELNNEPTDDLSLTAMLPANSTNYILIGLGVDFFERIGTKNYPMRPGTLSVIEVSKP
ncbi:MAG: hypothetical protein WCF67_20450 [Chitinophagaceae bacterium]